MSHVFISYNQSDFDFATVLKNQVEQAGFETWLDTDKLDAGEVWQPEIDRAIWEALALVVIMTPEAMRSAYINYEWAFALGAGVRVIPVLFKPTEPHPHLGTLQHLDFTQPNPRHRPWGELIAQLQKVMDSPPSPAIRVSRDTPLAIKQAVAALDSHRPEERLSAIESLAQMSHPEAREALAGAVQHPIRDVRIQAALMLAQFKDPRALPGLREALGDDNKYHLIGEPLANALKDIEFFRKILQGFEIVADPLRFLAVQSIRYAAVIAFGEIPDASVVTDLLKTLKDDDWRVCRISVFILGEIRNAAAVPGLLNALLDESESIRETAVMSLEKIGGTAAVQGLISFLLHESDDRPSNLRHNIARVLEHIDTQEALAAANEWKSRQSHGWIG